VRGILGNPWPIAAFSAFLVTPFLWASVDTTTIHGTLTGISVTVDSNGAYTITVQRPAWAFGGNVGQPLTDIAVATGTDAIGDYQELSFGYVEGWRRQGAIRSYIAKPVLLFTAKYLDSTPNTLAFPKLAIYPKNLRHLSYSGIFGIYTFEELGSDSPWVFFDADGNTFIVSPASRFMTATMTRGADQEIISRIDTDIRQLPQGTSHQTMLVVEKGINKAFDTWGRALTDLYGKTRPSNDADVSLKHLGYWTDNGAAYYYNFEPRLGYDGTLLAVRDDFARLGIPLGYMQLDSWFYPKGPAADWRKVFDGIYQYVADPSLFPQGLKTFQSQLGLPLIVHSRWIDARSPYRQQYQVSGNVSGDPLYWENITSYIRESGVRVYEQDWLGAHAQAALDLASPVAFMDNMAKSCRDRTITIQYCMPLPRHYLQSSKYNNVTTIRTSRDRFLREKWDEFLYGSRLAGALGLWPWTDVFMSSETDNLLLAVLSAGPVGVGDRIGSLDKANLMRAVRGDGIIVKPDAPIMPLDQSFLRDAGGLSEPMVAATYSDIGGFKAFYVFAYTRGNSNTVEFTPASLGMSGMVYLYDYFAGKGWLTDAGLTFRGAINNGRAYYILVPVGRSGVGFLGDAGQFVPLGRQRISQVLDNGALRAMVSFAKGEESRTLYGFAPWPPDVAALRGKFSELSFDSDKRLFRFEVSPDLDGSAMIEIRLRKSALPGLCSGQAGGKLDGSCTPCEPGSLCPDN
jgi:hypothetical protein